MHEMALTQGIIEICEKYASGKRVLALDVEIGQLSGVVPDAVEFCFEACSRGTLLEGARINVIHIPGTGRCRECGAESPLANIFDSCPACGGFQMELISGEEMRVREIEVE